MWETIKLGALCDVITKGTTPTSVGYKFQTEGVNFVKIESITPNGEFIPDKFACISFECHMALKRSQLICNDILFSIAGALGRTAIVPENVLPANTNQALAIIRLKKDVLINQEYLLLALGSGSILEQVLKMKGGVAQQNLSLTQLKSFEIPLPPLETQKFIVAKLDQAFADIEKAKANAEQNLKNSKELFESYLQGIFSHKQDGWVESSLQNITSKIGSGATPRGGKAAYKEQGMSLIRSMNVHDRRFKEKNLALIDDEQAEKLKNVTLEKDDVLLNITGASVARCCVVPDKYLPARVNQHVSIIRVDKDIVSPRFLCFLLTSTYYKNILLEVGGSGATREAITKVQLQNFIITYPDSVEKQEEFLDELTGIESKSLDLQNIYTQKIQALDELKQSILQKAFNGELA